MPKLRQEVNWVGNSHVWLVHRVSRPALSRAAIGQFADLSCDASERQQMPTSGLPWTKPLAR